MAGAASIKDVNFSQRGETKTETPFAEFEQIHLGSAQTVAPASGRVILKLIGAPRNGKLYLDGIDDVINPETKRKERIRLIKGEEEVWLKKQKDLDKEYILKNRRSLEFVKGVCILEETDTAAIRFAELSNCSADNPDAIPGKKHRFFKWNPIAQEKAALEKDALRFKAVQLAIAQPYGQAKKHAAFLGGVSFFDEFGNPRGEEGVRVQYQRRAEAIPQRFIDTIGAKEVEVSYLIRKAITSAQIDVAGAGGRVRWANGGGDICILPKGREAYEYLLEFALLPTEEAQTFLERLQKTA